jgi:hypothetical protein
MEQEWSSREGEKKKIKLKPKNKIKKNSNPPTHIQTVNPLARAVSTSSSLVRYEPIGFVGLREEDSASAAETLV